MEKHRDFLKDHGASTVQIYVAKKNKRSQKQLTQQLKTNCDT